jgi:hypothetical protein
MHSFTVMMAYLAPTRPQAKRVAWRDLKALTPQHWMLGLPNETELCIRSIFNSEIHVIGMDAPQRFEGNQWDIVVVDESSDQKPGIFERTIRPALTHRRGVCWRIGVPKRQGIGARDFRQFCERGFKGDDPDVETFTWPSWDIVPQEEIEAARRTMDAKDFNEQYGAAWQSIGGAAFYEFSNQVHVCKTAYNPKRPLLIASDFNVDPMAWTINQLTEDGTALITIDEIWLRNTNTKATLDVLWGRYGQHQGGFIFYGDATGRRRQTSASASDYAQIRNDKRFKAAKVIYPSHNPQVKDRLSSTNALLRNAANEIRWHIDERCLQLIADLENRGLDSDGLPTDADEFGGHITDAAGYLIHSKWPATRVEPSASATIGLYKG